MRDRKTAEKRLTLRKELIRKVEAFLYSNVEGQIPYGAWKTYLEELIEQDFRRREFVIAVQGNPNTFEHAMTSIEQYIQRVGNPEDITFLTHRLKTLRLHYETK